VTEDGDVMTTVKPSGARNGSECLSISKSKEHVHSKPAGSSRCQTWSIPESSNEILHITRSSDVWKATLQYQTSFLGQGSNETRFSGCIVLHMVMRDLDKIPTWLSS